MSLSASEAGWKKIFEHLELKAYLNRVKGSETSKRGYLTERDIWNAFEMLDAALLVRERSVRGIIAERMKEAGWTKDTLQAAGITTYLWHPPEGQV